MVGEGEGRVLNMEEIMTQKTGEEMRRQCLRVGGRELDLATSQSRPKIEYIVYSHQQELRHTGRWVGR